MKYILLLSLFFISSFSLTATEPTDAQTLYEQGIEYVIIAHSTDVNDIENLQNGFSVLKQSARLGHVEAQLALGRLYLEGYPAIAYRGFLKSYESRFFLMPDLIRVGNDPDRLEDIQQGIDWLDKAVNQDDSKVVQYKAGELLYRLSHFYWDHLEYKKKALAWLQQSADQGHQEAIDLLSEINSVEE